MTILEVWMAVCDGLGGVGSAIQGVPSYLLQFKRDFRTTAPLL